MVIHSCQEAATKRGEKTISVRGSAKNVTNENERSETASYHPHYQIGYKTTTKNLILKNNNIRFHPHEITAEHSAMNSSFYLKLN